MNRIDEMKNIQKQGLELFEKKNKDYGDSFSKKGLIGILIRISEKIDRSVNITNNEITLIDNESIRDTLIDLHNYSAMGIMLMNEKNKK